MGKSKKTSIQTFFQKKRKIYQSIKHKISTMDKKFFITSQITNKKAVLFCTWHPRKMKGYYSTRDSLNYLSENKRTLKSYEIFPKNLIFDTEKKNKISYEVTSIDFNLSGTLLSTTCYNGLFTIWTETGVLLYNTVFHNRALIESKWSENSRNNALAYLSGEIEIWSSWYLQRLLTFFPHRSMLVSLDWKNFESIVAFQKGEMFSSLNILKKEITVLKAHSSQINDLVYLAEKNIIVTCSDDLSIKIWKNDDRIKHLFSFYGHEKEVLNVTFNPFNFKKKKGPINTLILSGAMDFSIRIWDLTSRNCLRFFKVSGPVFSIEWSLCSNNLFIGTCGKIFQMNFENIIKEFIQCNRNKQGVFAIMCHPMVNKLMCHSFKNVLLL